MSSVVHGNIPEIASLILSASSARNVVVQDRTRHFHGALTDILNSFLVRQESEILRIPKDLRNVKMKDLKSMWGGDWASTLRHLKEETLKGKIEGDRIEDGKVQEEDPASDENDDKRKRKRPVLNSRTGSVETPTGRVKKTREFAFAQK